MGANHQPLQRFWPFTRDSLHIGSHHKQAAPRFVLEAPGWSHLHVVLQWPAKENNGDCSCAMPRENKSVLRTIPFTAEKRLLRSSGPEPPIGAFSLIPPTLRTWTRHQRWRKKWSGYLSILILMIHPGPDFGTFPMRVNSPVMATSACFGPRLSQGSHRLSAMKIRWRFNKVININLTLSQRKQAFKMIDILHVWLDNTLETPSKDVPARSSTTPTSLSRPQMGHPGRSP